jgi:hypothetical protein
LPYLHLFASPPPVVFGHAFVALNHALIILHPAILAFVASPFHISFWPCPCDILWYLVWAVWLRPPPPPLGEGLFGHCWALSICHLWKLFGNLIGIRGWYSTSTFLLIFHILFDFTIFDIHLSARF